MKCIKFLIKLLLKLYLLLVVLLMLLLILIGYGGLSYISIRNYCGYCTFPSYSQKHLSGLRFTTEERLDIAINHYLRNQIGIDYWEIQKMEQEESLSKENLEKRFTLIPYTDKETFLQANPGCCKRSWGVTGDRYKQFGFWERAEGAGDGMFNFRHKVRYMDKEGVYKEIETTNFYIAVDNCGREESRHYSKDALDIYDLPKGRK